MQAGRNVHLRIAAGECQLQLFDQFGIEDMFDEVRVTVDVAGGDVGMEDEVGFPETVVAGDGPRIAGSAFGKSPAVYDGLEKPVGDGSTDQSSESCG